MSVASLGAIHAPKQDLLCLSLQTPSRPRHQCRYHFNRGALLNVGAALLEGTAYDYYAFHDVDTICGPGPVVQYAYPSGVSPLHLTPPGLHPRDDFPEFLGGNIIFTRKQFQQVNGFHVSGHLLPNTHRF